MLNVLIATKYVDAPWVAKAIEDVDPQVSVTTCLYSESAFVRSARMDRPNASEMSAIFPALSEAQAAAFARADVCIAFDIPPDLPAVAPRLKWLHVISSGVAHCAHSGLPYGGVTVTHSPGVNASAVAEFVLARMLEHAKRLPELRGLQNAHVWRTSFGQCLEGRSLTIIGYGAVGRAVARLAGPFGMRVRAVARRPGTETCVPITDKLLEALKGAEFVVLCASDDPANRNMMDRTAFAAMSPGAFFVNVARGLLVDEAALADALQEGRLAGAALDVTVEEPMGQEHPLWTAPNISLSFHSAAAQDHAVERRVELILENLRLFLNGCTLRHVVDRLSTSGGGR